MQICTCAWSPLVGILLHQRNLQKYTLHMKHWTARIWQIWSSVLCFGVVSCSSFALNLYPLSFAVCRGKEMLLSVPGGTLWVLKHGPGCSVRHCTLQILSTGIWKVKYFLICSCSTSFMVSLQLWIPCVFFDTCWSASGTENVYSVFKRINVNIWTEAAAPWFPFFNPYKCTVNYISKGFL